MINAVVEATLSVLTFSDPMSGRRLYSGVQFLAGPAGPHRHFTFHRTARQRTASGAGGEGPRIPARCRAPVLHHTRAYTVCSDL